MDTAQAADFASHPPQRPLPVASLRPPATGRSLFVSPQGSDQADGSQAKPWKSLHFAVDKLTPGDTLYLRGGVHHTHTTLAAVGKLGLPITIRSYPGELAIIDGGLPEFLNAPAQAWEPCPGGVAGEFWSTNKYPELGGRPDTTNVLGNFADSMVPLHGYRFRTDLQSDNPFWNINSKVDDQGNVYCGPGLWYDMSTGRIHARLAHTKLDGLRGDNYRGETDPRKLPLVVAGHQGGPPLTLDGARHIRLQDLVLRGTREAALAIRNAANIELDGLTVYGGSAPILIRDTAGLLVQHTACRGLAAPWTFRGSLKYRAIESRLFTASGWDPTGVVNQNMEIAFCEFTDSVDGVFIGNVQGVQFHNNLLDNISDDGIFLTAGTAYDGTTPGGDVRIEQNHIARVLTSFAFGVGHGRQKTIATGKQLGAGVDICRNVFDFRRPVMYDWPRSADGPQEPTQHGRIGGDHGSPGWEPMRIYQNTILAGGTPRYDYGTEGLAHGIGGGTKRRVFNNIVCLMTGQPGQSLPEPKHDFQADGNLFWSDAEHEAVPPWAEKFRRSPAFAQSQRDYPPGWTTNDRFADPKFVSYSADWHQTVDLSLQKESPARGTGVVLPADWPDPLRTSEADRPDIGALPVGQQPWRVGVQGRFDVFGRPAAGTPVASLTKSVYSPEPDPPTGYHPPRAVVVTGYPAFDAPIAAYALRHRGALVDLLERQWLPVFEYARYPVVMIDGSFTRGKIEPSKYSLEDLTKLRAYLEKGGTLILFRDRLDVFQSPEGREFLDSVFAPGPIEQGGGVQIRLPDHPWVRHLTGDQPRPWMESKPSGLLRMTRGENIIGTKSSALLGTAPLGQGRIVYFGLSVAAALPNGRQPSTVEREALLEEQYRVLSNVVESVLPAPPK